MNKQNKITITLAPEQVATLEKVAHRKGIPVTTMLRFWVLDIMDVEGLLSDNHPCPMCGNETYGIKNQICADCEKIIPVED